MRHLLVQLVTPALLIASTLTGCGSSSATIAPVPMASSLTLEAAASSEGTDDARYAAGDEWVEWIVTVSGDAASLRLSAARDSAGVDWFPDHAIYRLRDLAPPTPTPSLMRSLGGPVATSPKPFALVELRRDATGTRHRLGGGRGALWVEVKLPRGMPAGEVSLQLEALDADGNLVDRLPLPIVSRGFDLPAYPTLTPFAVQSWDDLAETFTEEFAGVEARTVSRSDPAHAGAVSVLDDLIALARQDGLEVHLPDVAPHVTWPPGGVPEIDWSDYDALVSPWLAGSVRPRAFPMPAARGADGRPAAQRAAYWKLVGDHFRENGWTTASAAWLATSDDDALSFTDAARLNVEAGRVATATLDARIALPLEEDRLRFAGPGYDGLFPAGRSGDLIPQAEPAVARALRRPWPAGLDEPTAAWLDAREQAIVSRAGVRSLAWTSFLRGATLLRCPSAVPGDRADVESPWVVPGEQIGVDRALVPTLRMKWLRRAAQDHAYLVAASESGRRDEATEIAAAAVKPIIAGEAVFLPSSIDLLVGLSDDAAWQQALDLVGDLAADERSRFHRRQVWLANQRQPQPLVGRVRWDLLDVDLNRLQSEASRQFSGTASTPRIERRVFRELDVWFRAFDTARPEGFGLTLVGGRSALDWRATPSDTIDALPVGELHRADLRTWTTADTPAPAADESLAIRDGFTGDNASVPFHLPAERIRQRSDTPQLDASLGDWRASDQINADPLVAFQDHQTIRTAELERTGEPVQLFAAWTRFGLHLAFEAEVTQIESSNRFTRTFVDLDAGRVSGEDAIELFLQPLRVEGAGETVPGPRLHLVLKPNGTVVARRGSAAGSIIAWEPVAADLRFASTTTDAGRWRAELTVPWASLNLLDDPAGSRSATALGRVPDLLSFNLAQHRPAARPGSWAGPVDQISDGRITGALILSRGDE